MQRLNSHYKGWSYKKKKKKLKIIEENCLEKTQGKKCLLTLDLKPVKGKHSASKEFQSPAVQGKKLLTYKFLQHLGGILTEKSCNLLE